MNSLQSLLDELQAGPPQRPPPIPSSLRPGSQPQQQPPASVGSQSPWPTDQRTVASARKQHTGPARGGPPPTTIITTQPASGPAASPIPQHPPPDPPQPQRGRQGQGQGQPRRASRPEQQLPRPSDATKASSRARPPAGSPASTMAPPAHPKTLVIPAVPPSTTQTHPVPAAPRQLNGSGSGASYRPPQSQGPIQPPHPSHAPPRAPTQHPAEALRASGPPAAFNPRSYQGPVRWGGNGSGTGRGGGDFGGHGSGFASPSLPPRRHLPFTPAAEGLPELRRVAQPGVVRKGSQMAVMQDGIFDTDIPGVYRVHSTSGAVEFRITDMNRLMCSCPNDMLICSHMYAVAVAKKEHRAKLGLFAQCLMVLERLADREQLPRPSTGRTGGPALSEQIQREGQIFYNEHVKNHSPKSEGLQHLWSDVATAALLHVCTYRHQFGKPMVHEQWWNELVEEGAEARRQVLEAAVKVAGAGPGDSLPTNKQAEGGASVPPKSDGEKDDAAAPSQPGPDTRSPAEPSATAVATPPPGVATSEGNASEGGSGAPAKPVDVPSSGSMAGLAGPQRIELLSTLAASPTAVLSFVTQALGAMGQSWDTAGAAPQGPGSEHADLVWEVESAACRHFGVRSFSDIGLGALPSFLGEFKGSAIEGTRGIQGSRVHYAEALLASGSLVAVPGLTASSLSPPLPQLPYGAPITWCGSVSASTLESGPLLTIELPGGAILGVPCPNAAPGVPLTRSLTDALDALDAPSAVSALLHCVVQHGGVWLLPTSLLQALASQALEKAAKTLSSTGVAGYISGLAAFLPYPFSCSREILSILLPPGLRSAWEAAAEPAIQHLLEPHLRLGYSEPAFAAERLMNLETILAAAGLENSSKAAADAARRVPAMTGPEQPTLVHPRKAQRTPRTPVAPSPAPHAASTPGPLNEAEEEEEEVMLPALTAPSSAAGLSKPAVAEVESFSAATDAGPEVLGPTDPAHAARCKLIIASIRRDEYGEGIVLGPEAEAVQRKARERLKRSVERLSMDLYSSERHVLHEVLQNADDCSYPPGVTPTMSLLSTPHGLCVVTNECGFTERDVRALCDVSNSSKGNGADAGASGVEDGGRGALPDMARTGEKGIGFKSVFLLSDQPHIWSGGFSFRFNALDPSGLGYVMPEWVSSAPAASVPELSSLPPGTSVRTIIWLPWRKGGRQGGIAPRAPEELRQEILRELSPSLLLFLRRLGRVELTDTVEQRRLTIDRLVNPVPWSARFLGITLASRALSMHSPPAAPPEETEATWLVFRHVDTDLPVHRKAKRVPATIVGLGFPVAPSSGPALGSQMVYACLPVRDFGLPFAVQADWVVPASREDITVDDPWNQHLRSLIPAAFSAALKEALAAAGTGAAGASGARALVDGTLRLVPSLSSVQGHFFKSLCPQIEHELRSIPFVPGEDPFSPFAPSQVLLAPPTLSGVLPSSWSLAALGRALPAYSFLTQLAEAPRSLSDTLVRLGAKELSVADVAAILEYGAAARHDEAVELLPAAATGRLLSTLPELDRGRGWGGAAHASSGSSKALLARIPFIPAVHAPSEGVGAERTSAVLYATALPASGTPLFTGHPVAVIPSDLEGFIESGVQPALDGSDGIEDLSHWPGVAMADLGALSGGLASAEDRRALVRGLEEIGVGRISQAALLQHVAAPLLREIGAHVSLHGPISVNSSGMLQLGRRLLPASALVSALGLVRFKGSSLASLGLEAHGLPLILQKRERSSAAVICLGKESGTRLHLARPPAQGASDLTVEEDGGPDTDGPVLGPILPMSELLERLWDGKMACLADAYFSAAALDEWKSFFQGIGLLPSFVTTERASTEGVAVPEARSILAARFKLASEASEAVYASAASVLHRSGSLLEALADTSRLAAALDGDSEGMVSLEDSTSSELASMLQGLERCPREDRARLAVSLLCQLDEALLSDKEGLFVRALVCRATLTTASGSVTFGVVSCLWETLVGSEWLPAALNHTASSSPGYLVGFARPGSLLAPQLHSSTAPIGLTVYHAPRLSHITRSVLALGDSAAPRHVQEHLRALRKAVQTGHATDSDALASALQAFRLLADAVRHGRTRPGQLAAAFGDPDDPLIPVFESPASAALEDGPESRGSLRFISARQTFWELPSSFSDLLQCPRLQSLSGLAGTLPADLGDFVCDGECGFGVSRLPSPAVLMQAADEAVGLGGDGGCLLPLLGALCTEGDGLGTWIGEGAIEGIPLFPLRDMAGSDRGSDHQPFALSLRQLRSAIQAGATILIPATGSSGTGLPPTGTLPSLAEAAELELQLAVSISDAARSTVRILDTERIAAWYEGSQPSSAPRDGALATVSVLASRAVNALAPAGSVLDLASLIRAQAHTEGPAATLTTVEQEISLALRLVSLAAKGASSSGECQPLTDVAVAVLQFASLKLSFSASVSLPSASGSLVACSSSPRDALSHVAGPASPPLIALLVGSALLSPGAASPDSISIRTSRALRKEVVKRLSDAVASILGGSSEPSINRKPILAMLGPALSAAADSLAEADAGPAEDFLLEHRGLDHPSLGPQELALIHGKGMVGRSRESAAALAELLASILHSGNEDNGVRSSAPSREGLEVGPIGNGADDASPRASPRPSEGIGHYNEPYFGRQRELSPPPEFHSFFGGHRQLGEDRPLGQFWGSEAEDLEVFRDRIRSRMAVQEEILARQSGDEARRSEVGRFGERYVYEYLLAAYEGQAHMRVEWVNRDEESLAPYDVLVRDLQAGTCDFIEVKASKTKDRAMFEMSHSEFLKAQLEGKRYWIYRVLGVGSPDIRIVRIHNPYLQFRQQKVGICLTL